MGDVGIEQSASVTAGAGERAQLGAPFRISNVGAIGARADDGRKTSSLRVKTTAAWLVASSCAEPADLLDAGSGIAVRALLGAGARRRNRDLFRRTPRSQQRNRRTLIAAMRVKVRRPATMRDVVTATIEGCGSRCFFPAFEIL
jgi:hypothetical protein